MLLELQNLGKSFGEHEVLRDVNAGVERGDRIGIIGANGTGKTTFLRRYVQYLVAQGHSVCIWKTTSAR